MKLKNIELKQYYSNIKNDIYARDHIIKELIDLSLPKLQSSNLFLTHCNINCSLFQRSLKQNNSQQQNDEFILSELLTLKPDIVFNQQFKSFQTAQNQYQEYLENTQNVTKTFDKQFEYLSQKVTEQILYLIRTQQNAFKSLNIQNLTKILVFNSENSDTQICVREFQFCFDKIWKQLMNIECQQHQKCISFNSDKKNTIKQRKIKKLEISTFFRSYLFKEKLAFNQKFKYQTTNLKNNIFQIKLITKVSNYFIFQIEFTKTNNSKINSINVLIVYQQPLDPNIIVSDQQKNSTVLNQQIKQLSLSQIFIYQIQFILFLQYLKMINSHSQTKINQTQKIIYQSGTIFHIKQVASNATTIINTIKINAATTKGTATNATTNNETTTTNSTSNESNLSLFQVSFTRQYQEMFQLTFQLLVQLLYTLHNGQKIAFQFIWLQKILKQFRNCDTYNIQKCIGKALIFNSSDQDYVKNIILLIQFLESFKLQQLPLFHQKTLHFFNLNDIKNLYQYQKISQYFDNYCFLYFASQNSEDINKIDNYQTTKNQDYSIQPVLQINKDLNQQKIVKFDQFIDLYALQQASWKNQLSQRYQDENDYQYL